MSMPDLPCMPKGMSRSDVINLILMSIAEEELALGHLVEAESKKINFVTEQVKKHNYCFDELLKVNESVNGILERVMEIEKLLTEKSENILKHRWHEFSAPPCHIPKPLPAPYPLPETPCFDCSDDCISVFEAHKCIIWRQFCKLTFSNTFVCDDDVYMNGACCKTELHLKGKTEYAVTFKLNLKKFNNTDIEYEVLINREVFRKDKVFGNNIRNSFIVDCRRVPSVLSFRLLSGDVKVLDGCIEVEEI